MSQFANSNYLLIPITTNAIILIIILSPSSQCLFPYPLTHKIKELTQLQLHLSTTSLLDVNTTFQTSKLHWHKHGIRYLVAEKESRRSFKRVTSYRSGIFSNLNTTYITIFLLQKHKQTNQHCFKYFQKQQQLLIERVMDLEEDTSICEWVKMAEFDMRSWTMAAERVEVTAADENELRNAECGGATS